MSVDVIVEDPGWEALPLETLAAAALDAVARKLGLGKGAEVALLATSDGAIATLNADFRGKAQPTNVLSWPASQVAPAAPGATPPLPEPDAFGELFLGDIAMAYQTCAREAEMGGKPLKDHSLHLMVHGILHLLGYDHICDEDAALMERLEAEILFGLGVPNPYSDQG